MKIKHTSRKRKEPCDADPEFFQTHFSNQPLQKQYVDRFMSSKVIPTYFLKLDVLEHLSICGKSLMTLIVDMGWKHVLTLREPVYPTLVKVFYSNILIAKNTPNRIITNVAGIEIGFDVDILNRILRTPNDGHHVYSSRRRIKEPWYSVVDAVRNICRRSNLSEIFCNSSFKSQALPLQVRVLHSILQHIISHRQGHWDLVTRLDVVLLDSILLGRKINVGYIILQHMLSTPGLDTRSLPFGGIITRILRNFKVPISEPSHDQPKELGEDVITSLGFAWEDNYSQWTKDRRLNNKPTEMALKDDQFFNDVTPPDKLPNLHIYLHGASRPSRASRSDHSCADNVPSSLRAEDSMQQLLTEVRSIYIQQTEVRSQIATIQEDQQRLFSQQQQILDGQQLIFRHFGIFLGSSSSSNPPHPPQ